LRGTLSGHTPPRTQPSSTHLPAAMLEKDSRLLQRRAQPVSEDPCASATALSVAGPLVHWRLPTAPERARASPFPDRRSERREEHQARESPAWFPRPLEDSLMSAANSVRFARPRRSLALLAQRVFDNFHDAIAPHLRIRRRLSRAISRDPPARAPRLDGSRPS
jgi:hypothetical protein